jgi:hypothetical protein
MSSCEKYNPETNTWSPVPDMHRPRSSVATAVIDDMIFVIGGFDSGATTNHVEHFNEEDNEWLVY